MRSLSFALISTLFTVPVLAQVVHTRTDTRSAAGTVAAAPAPPVIASVPNQSMVVPSGMAVFLSLPVVVLPDGRVFANFGRGYEQVVQSCAAVVNVVTVNTQPAVSQPVVVQPQPGLPTAQPVVVYSTPVPYQQTASQQMVNVATQQTLATQSTVVNSTACWSSNWQGQVFIARP